MPSFSQPPSSADPKIAALRLSPGSESCFTLKPLPGEGIREMFARLALALKDSATTPLKLMVFGSVSAWPAAEEAVRRAFGKIDWPVTWVEGAACNGDPIAGIQAFAFTAGRVDRITLNDRVVGSVFEDGAIRHCLLGGLGPQSVSASRPDQFRQTLTILETALSQAGFALGDVVRTWFYLDDLLSWYAPFNQARTEAYSRVKFRSGSLPASTGISAKNPDGAALVAGALALQPLNSAAQGAGQDSARSPLSPRLRGESRREGFPEVVLHPTAHISEVHSPLQCPATAYGSSFSRAMEISSLHGRRLMVSGTASIAPGGKTLWPGDLRQQIQTTMEVIEVILTSRGFEYADITRATAYFKDPAGLPEFESWCAVRNLHSLPVLPAHCGICRADLLFELEADAWKPAPAI
jgi:enamine deaminase RidA (YjgF/YER057c/UK114 family)